MRVRVAPFLVAPTETVVHSGWRQAGVSDDRLLGPGVADWDYQTVLSLHTAVAVDQAAVMHACRLGSDSALALIVRAGSSATGITQHVAQAAVPTGDSIEIPLQFDLSGHQLGGRLSLYTELVVLRADPLSELSPQVKGSRLWTHREVAVLEGHGSQFPTLAEDFSVTRPMIRRAAWYLELDVSDLGASFMGSCTLVLNTAVGTVRSLLEGDETDAVEALQRVLKWDITRQLAMNALSSDEVLDLEFDAGAHSVGGILRNLLAAVWPQESPRTVRRWMTADRSRVEAHLLSYCRGVQ